MTQKYFNFNNEADLTPVEVDELSGEVLFSYEGREATFDSLQEFAEFYATARNVLPENLKNWELTEDGESFAFVLKAGTAGITADEITTLVQSLTAAGLSPDAIGEAVAAATRENSVSEITPVNDTANLSRTTEEVRLDWVARTVAELSPFNKRLLMKDKDVTTEDELVNVFNVANITTAEIKDEYYDPEYDDESDRYYTASGSEAVSYNIQKAINSARLALSTTHPNIPIEIALDIETNTDQTEEELNAGRALLSKRNMVAAIAGRQVPITVITQGEIITGEYTEAAMDDVRGIYNIKNRIFVLV